MQPKYKKISMLLLSIALMHGIEACFDCGCPAFLGHYEFKALKLDTPALNAGEDFYMLLRADSVTYVADASTRPSFHWNSSAWACKCLEDGSLGAQFPIKSIDIYADRDFNDTLPTGKALNDLFQISDAFSNSGTNLTKFNAQEARWEVFRIDQGAARLLLTDEPTHPGLPYRFRVELTNSRGDIYSAVSDTISF